MKKIISFMHISLDGFVAGPNGEMDWIKADQEIFEHVGKRISKSNTALYGRVTYRMMEDYWPGAADKPNASQHDIQHAAWYQKVHKVVLSKTLNGTDVVNTKIINGNLSGEINGIKQLDDGGSDDILLFGSPTATHSLIQQDLIDGYWLFVNPVILGKGIPLFKNIPHKTTLQLISTRAFACGVTELNYLLDRSSV